jgi:hypothetical protein
MTDKQIALLKACAMGISQLGSLVHPATMVAIVKAYNELEEEDKKRISSFSGSGTHDLK